MLKFNKAFLPSSFFSQNMGWTWRSYLVFTWSKTLSLSLSLFCFPKGFMIEISTLGLLDWNCLFGFFGLKWAIWGIPDWIEKIGFVGLKEISNLSFRDWIQIFRFVGLKSAIWGFFQILNSDIWVCWDWNQQFGFSSIWIQLFEVCWICSQPFEFLFLKSTTWIWICLPCTRIYWGVFCSGHTQAMARSTCKNANILENIHMHKLFFHTQNLTNLSLRFCR